MMFAFVLVALVGVAGIAVDFLRSNELQAELAEAADAGVLAGARAKLVDDVLTDAAAEAVAQKLFDGNRRFADRVAIETFDFNHDEATQTFSLAITGKMNTTFMNVFGWKTLDIDVYSEAKVAPPRVLEVVLALDNTNSMSGAKMTALKSAASDLVNAVMAEADNDVKIGIVPFSNYVNVGVSRRGASWLNAPADSSATVNKCNTTYPDATSTNCVTTSSTCYNDGVPYACTGTSCDWDYGDPVTTCADVVENHLWRGCVGSRDQPRDVKDEDYAVHKVPGLLDEWCPEEVLPLTTDKATVENKIDALSVIGDTYIPSGLFWAQALISEEEPFAGGVSYAEMEAESGVKAIVLMTDGLNSRSARYPDHWGNDTSAANDKTEQLCTEIKSKKIQVYTIAFEVTDTTVKDLLRDCASSPDEFFDAADAAELSSAFESIGSSLQELSLSK